MWNKEQRQSWPNGCQSSDKADRLVPLVRATGEFPRIPGNMAFVKFTREFPDFFSSLNLDYLRTNFRVKNLIYVLNAKQWYFVTRSYIAEDFEKRLF